MNVTRTQVTTAMVVVGALIAWNAFIAPKINAPQA